MTNRLTTEIAKVQIRINALSEDKVKNLAESMSISFQDHFEYQNLQASAFASGRLTLDEAQLIYHALGEIHNSEQGGWDTTDLATIVVVTMTVGELLGVTA